MPAKKDDYPATARISSYDHNSAWYSDPADVEFALDGEGPVRGGRVRLDRL